MQSNIESPSSLSDPKEGQNPSSLTDKSFETTSITQTCAPLGSAPPSPIINLPPLSTQDVFSLNKTEPPTLTPSSDENTIQEAKPEHTVPTSPSQQAPAYRSQRTCDVPKDGSCLIHCFVLTLAIIWYAKEYLGISKNPELVEALFTDTTSYKDTKYTLENDLKLLLQSVIESIPNQSPLFKLALYRRIGFTFLRTYLNNPERQRDNSAIKELLCKNNDDKKFWPRFEPHAKKVLKDKNFGSGKTLWLLDTDLGHFIQHLGIGKSKANDCTFNHFPITEKGEIIIHLDSFEQHWTLRFDQTLLDQMKNKLTNIDPPIQYLKQVANHTLSAHYLHNGLIAKPTPHTLSTPAPIEDYAHQEHVYRTVRLRFNANPHQKPACTEHPVSLHIHNQASTDQASEVLPTTQSAAQTPPESKKAVQSMRSDAINQQNAVPYSKKGAVKRKIPAPLQKLAIKKPAPPATYPHAPTAPSPSCWQPTQNTLPFTVPPLKRTNFFPPHSPPSDSTPEASGLESRDLTYQLLHSLPSYITPCTYLQWSRENAKILAYYRKLEQEPSSSPATHPQASSFERFLHALTPLKPRRIQGAQEQKPVEPSKPENMISQKFAKDIIRTLPQPLTPDQLSIWKSSHPEICEKFKKSEPSLGKKLMRSTDSSPLEQFLEAVANANAKHAASLA